MFHLFILQFHHHVKSISPLEGDRWLLTVINLQDNITETSEFDGIIVCIGYLSFFVFIHFDSSMWVVVVRIFTNKLLICFRNYSNPVIPDVPGIEKFRGMKIHSHDYRDSSVFKDKSTVVIGCGPSGLDISFDIAKVAGKVRIKIIYYTFVPNLFLFLVPILFEIKTKIIFSLRCT